MSTACETVRNIFNEAQRGFQHHAKLIRALKKIQDSFSSQEEFVETFIHHVRYAMIVFKREPAVERIIEFVAKYSTSNVHYDTPPKRSDNLSDDENEAEFTNQFLQYIFAFVLDCHDAKDKAVRFRACQLINKLLSNMDDEASIDDDIADAIMTCMLKRLQDKIPAVRVQAVCAVSRLQDPSDGECPVFSSYLQMMATDSSADVRKAVLLNVALTRQSLSVVIARTHDVTETVRKLAYCIIAEKVKIQSLSIAMRVQLLQDGLNDRSPAIQASCSKSLLHGWLNSFEGNIVDLLKCLDIENSASTAESSVKVLLKAMPKEELLDQIKSLKPDPTLPGPVSIPYDHLDCESSFYWRCLGQHIKSLGVEGEELLDLLLPEVSGFCEYLQGYTKKMFTSLPEVTDGKVMQQTFVTQQLLLLMGVVDLSDEVGRKRLGKLVHDILVSPYIPESLVAVLLARHMEVQEEEDTRIQELVEIIADVRQPIVMVEAAVSAEEQRKQELKLAAAKVRLMQLRDDLEKSISDQDFSKAAELKLQITELESGINAINDTSASVSMAIREEKDDPVTLFKCLTIACEMLQTTTRNGLNPTLMTLVETLVIPGVQNEDPQVRNAAIKCLGLCALLSCEFARKHLVLFLQVAQLDQEIVQVTALQVVFDLLLKFGLEAFKLNPNKELLDQGNNDTEEDKDDEEQDERDKENEREDEREDEVTNEPVNTAMSVLAILTELLESESNDLRNVAAEGLAKLLLSGRVLSAKLFSRLILLWYNPTTEEDGNLRHCLGVFMPVFAFASRSNQELVEDAFLPTLKTLFSAPSSSPLASINSNNVAELLIELTNSRRFTNNDNSAAIEGCSHVSLALKVANEILSDPDAPGTRVLCKVLTSLDVTGCDQTSVKDLKVLAYKLFQAIDESACVKLLDKFQKTLDLMDKSRDEDTPNGGTANSDDTPDDNSNGAGEDDAESPAQRDNTSSNTAVDQADSIGAPCTTDDSQADSIGAACTTDGSQAVNLNDSKNTRDVDEHSENEIEHIESPAHSETAPSAITPKPRPHRVKQPNNSKVTSSVVAAMPGTRTRSKRNAKSVSDLKTKLNLSDSDESDKENSQVFQ